MSQAFVDLAASDDLFSLNLLDLIFRDISFTAYRSTRRFQVVVGGKTMVLCNVKESDEDAFCERLLDTRQLFWKTRWDGAADLFIEFPRTDQIEDLILQARQLLPELAIVSWPEYSSQFAKKKSNDKLKTVNMYGLLDLSCTTEDERQDAKIEEPTTEDYSANDHINSRNEKDDGGWSTVVNQPDIGWRHRNAINQEEDCRYGLRCKKRDDCPFRHTAKERELFREKPNQNLGLRKTKWCRNIPNCKYGRECMFAHSKVEAVCLDCRQIGHFQGDAVNCLLRAQ